MRYKVTPTGSYVNLRADHTTGSADVGDLAAGQYAFGNEVWGDGIQELWLHALEVNGIAKDCWIAVKNQGTAFSTLTDLGPITPPPPTEVEYFEAVFKDGTRQRFVPAL